MKSSPPKRAFYAPLASRFARFRTRLILRNQVELTPKGCPNEASSVNTSKAGLRNVILDIVFGRETVHYSPTQFEHLAIGVAEVLQRRQGPPSASVWPAGDQRLCEADWLLVNEIFWDLVAERVLTPGMNSSNLKFPWFRLHSEAAANLVAAK
jgi:hypothetical protein